MPDDEGAGPGLHNIEKLQVFIARGLAEERRPRDDGAEKEEHTDF